MTTDEARIRELVRQVVYRTVDRLPPSHTGQTRTLVTQSDLEGLPPGAEYKIPGGALITPLARQSAMERRISLIAGPESSAAGAPSTPRPASSVASRATSETRPGSGGKTVAIGADHGGFELKEMLKDHLAALGFQVVDCGTDSKESVDYPDLALAVAQLVARGRAWRGVVVDGAGIGSCMVANKVPGVRAALCYDEATAVNSRAHNAANVLTLGAGLIGPALGRRILTTWLNTPAGGGRHARRVDMIMDIESRYLTAGGTSRSRRSIRHGV
jgi:ribose 5-phosphate isomerase B